MGWVAFFPFQVGTHQLQEQDVRHRASKDSSFNQY